jgi:hypothetical protein
MSLAPTTSATTEPDVTRSVQRQPHDERFSALAAAVRDHEARARELLVGVRAHDLELYRRLRQICGKFERSPGLPGDEPG